METLSRLAGVLQRQETFSIISPQGDGNLKRPSWDTMSIAAPFSIISPQGDGNAEVNLEVGVAYSFFNHFPARGWKRRE